MIYREKIAIYLLRNPWVSFQNSFHSKCLLPYDALGNAQRILKSFIQQTRDAWVAQSVKHLTLDLGSGHDLRVMGSSPASGSALDGESA